jgi:hypothetical protein
VVQSRYGPVGVTLDPGGGVRVVELLPGWESASASELGHAVTCAVTAADVRRATPARGPAPCSPGAVAAVFALLDRAASSEPVSAESAPPESAAASAVSCPPAPAPTRPGPPHTGRLRRTPRTPGCADQPGPPGPPEPAAAARPGGSVQVLATRGRVLAVVIDATWLRAAECRRVERDLRRALRAARPAPGPDLGALAAMPVIRDDGELVLL